MVTIPHPTSSCDSDISDVDIVERLDRSTDRRNVPPRENPGKQHIGWDLSNDITDSIYGRAGDELVAYSAISSTTKKGVVDVGQINILRK